MENSLPKGWVSVSPLEIAEKIRGVSYGREDVIGGTSKGYLPVLRANGIDDNKIVYKDLVYVKSAQISTNQFLRDGDVLIAMSSGSKNLVGKTAQFFGENKISFGAFCGVLRPNAELNPKYFGYFFQSKNYRDTISDSAAGTNINNLKNEHFESLRIPIAPLAEQHRIVAKLDELMEKIDRSRTRLDRFPKIMKRFRQSILSDAVSGRLTEEWREKQKVENASVSLKDYIAKRIHIFDLKTANAKANKIPKPSKPNYFQYSFENDTHTNAELPPSWIVSKVGLLCDCIVPGRDKPKSFTGKVPWITLPEIESEEIGGESGKLKLSEAEILEVNARVIPEESVIMSCIGRFGISAIVKSPIVINQQLHAFLKSEVVLPKYLMYHLRILEEYQNSIATSTTIAYLNKTNCNSLPINLPPIEEQSEIVRRIEQFFFLADKIQARYIKAKALVDDLPQSLLAKAFRGELVAQDPNDESASVLLERIKSGRVEQAPRKSKKTKVYKLKTGLSLAAEP